MTRLIVGGTFDHNGGKSSKIVNELSDYLLWPAFNGGYLNDLKDIDFTKYEAMIWMPNIDNSEDKILPSIKKINQKLLLIQSKNTLNSDCTDNDIIGRLLASHSALGIKIYKNQNEDRYRFKLLDPLGNMWTDTDSISELALAIKKRTDHVLRMKRVRSVQVGPKNEFEIDPEFITIIQSYGTQFTQFVNAINPNRLLGNASTRCARGFPGIRTDSALYVTRRNVDKQTLSTNDFVEILPEESEVRYFGDAKPSVDTPIQIRLFNYYKNVNYMLHGHVYVKTGLITDNKIPCGFIDEFDEITHLIPDKDASNFVINLKGHGCLIMANNLEFFANQELIGRPFPEGN